MAQDTTLTETDIKKLAQRGGMELGDQQNFWEWYQAVTTLSGNLAEPIEVEGARDEPEGALASLLTALETLGLITDSTTAS